MVSLPSVFAARSTENKRDIAPIIMYFVALAADYDGTIAHDGVVALKTVEALTRLKQTGRRLLLVTGRTLPSVKKAFSGLALFDRVVAENGAVLYDPAADKEKVLAPPPPVRLVAALQNLAVTPLTVGSCVISTWEPHQNTVLEQIQALGLELQIIFNKGAVRVLPPGVNKASGLAEALRELEISCKNVVGVGDAENDHAFLRACGCAAAVANALPAVKAAADIRLNGDEGIGVIELVGLMSDETAPLSPPRRHELLIGVDRENREVHVKPHHGSVLVAGKSGSENSTFVTALTERMVEGDSGSASLTPQGPIANSSTRSPRATRTRHPSSRKRSIWSARWLRTWS